MVRVVKTASERKDEILDAAQRLFITQGFTATTISDLLSEVQIARGTFYHHFRSKEEVLDAIIERHGDSVLERVNTIAHSPGLATQKFLACLAALAPQDESQAALITEMSESSNTALFTKTLHDLVNRIAPAIARVVEQGVADGEMSSPHPLEAVRLLLASSYVLIDSRPAVLSEGDRAHQLEATLRSAELLLGLPEGTLFTFLRSSSQAN